MANRAADFVEQGETLHGSVTAGERRIARGRLSGANEAGEVVDIGKAVRPRLVIRFGDGVAEFGYLVGLQAIGDAHFVEISVAGER